jgi:hypothetical protein
LQGDFKGGRGLTQMVAFLASLFCVVTTVHAAIDRQAMALLVDAPHEGPNCISAALVGSGLADAPFFISSLEFDRALGSCFKPISQPSAGDWGIVRFSTLLAHVFLYLDDQKAFSKADMWSPFMILSIPDAIGFKERGSSVTALHYIGGPDCEIAKHIVESQHRAPLLQEAALYLRGRFRFSEPHPPSPQTLAAWELALSLPAQNSQLSFLDRAMIKDAIGTADVPTAAKLLTDLDIRIQEIFESWEVRIRASLLSPQEKDLFHKIFLKPAQYVNWDSNLSYSVWSARVELKDIQRLECKNKQRTHLNCGDTESLNSQTLQDLKKFAQVLGGEIDTQQQHPFTADQPFATQFSHVSWHHPEMEVTIFVN